MDFPREFGEGGGSLGGEIWELEALGEKGLMDGGDLIACKKKKICIYRHARYGARVFCVLRGVVEGKVVLDSKILLNLLYSSN